MFQLSKNCGTITIAHFGRILYFLGITLGVDEFNLLVKKYLKDSCTLSYNAFLARLDAITRYWEENGFTDLGGVSATVTEHPTSSNTLTPR